MSAPAALATNHAEHADQPTQPRRFFKSVDGTWHVQITQGETFVTSAVDEVLTTVLGSCVAACICDPVAKVGGMNHFLLPDGDARDGDALCYGVNAMELLINGLLQRGGRRERMEAKLFGGAKVIAAFSDIGARNAEFARWFLSEEGIRVTGGDLGGTVARRVEYWPVTGRARQRVVDRDAAEVVRSELARADTHSETRKAKGDDVEFF